MILIPLAPLLPNFFPSFSLSWDRFLYTWGSFLSVSDSLLAFHISPPLKCKYFKHLTRILTDASTLSRWLFGHEKKLEGGFDLIFLNLKHKIWMIFTSRSLFSLTFFLSLFFFFVLCWNRRARACLTRRCASVRALGCLHFALVSLSLLTMWFA